MVHSGIWEALDRLITIEFRSAELNPGTLAVLYDAAREKLGGPVLQVASTRLDQVLRPGAPVVLTTGAGGPPWLFQGETDGPLGLAGLARALSLGYGAWPLVVTEARSVGPVTATLVAGGVSVLDEALARVRPTTASLLPFTTDPAIAQRDAQVLLDRWAPVAVIAIEKTSPNRAGVIHSVSGKAWTPAVEFARVEALIAEARRRGMLTIGVGDMGNEMGFGLIEDTVRKTVARADVCQCPCGQGMASAVTTDVLVPASVSNWGAYGIEAGLAILRGRPDVFHDAATERAMLYACAAAGAVDGLTSRQILAVDGTSGETQVAVITMLAELIGKALSARPVDY
jgi:D-glutamate cyclase